MIPSGRLWVLLCLLALPTMAAGFITGIGPLVAFFDVVLLAIAAADFAVARKTQLKVWREMPVRFQVGVAAPIAIHLVNPGRAVNIELRDDSPLEFESSPEQLSLSLAGATRGRVTYTTTPSKRGRFEFGDLHVRVRGPLGFTWHERVIPAATSVSVFPDMRGASRLLLSDAALDFVNLGLRQLRRDGRGSEFARLRDYAQGDSVRDVDWKATARRGKPVTRVMESERSQTVLIGVDAGRSMAARVDGLTKLDHAVNAALFLAFVAVRNGDRVGLVVFADGIKTYLAPANGRLQYRKIVDALYTAKPHLTYVDYLALFKELNVRLVKRSLLCVFTDFIDEDQAQTMVDPMRRLAKRHVPLCLSVKDAALGELLSTPPKDPELAYQHAVASELLLEREAMKRKVGQDGVTVVDVEADQLSLAAVNRYLEIKARGTL
ncbi:MAG: DUF58 domain-containing protein [Archangium gephyra]|uniref:DUF58 domain-containing protein n=1 Tax=Archangium gephyra TaxID=48 RepID=A0A2W5SWZ4_9BACT|nr:MAG: DUF58 domain-containing protein [Archangium gephyra]